MAKARSDIATALAHNTSLTIHGRPPTDKEGLDDLLLRLEKIVKKIKKEAYFTAAGT